MRKWVVDLLRCPNSGGAVNTFAIEFNRKGTRLKYKFQSELVAEDEISLGIIVNLDNKTAYPIYHGIGILLSDIDTNISLHIDLLKELKPQCPSEFHEPICCTIERISRRDMTSDSIWNQEEMKYYDSRDQLLYLVPTPADVRKGKNVDWYRIIARKKNLINPLLPFISGKALLEIGCGSAKTISRLMPPTQYHYRYVGLDISFQRLLWASSILPEGSFLQGSALNLPFISGCFDIAIALGTWQCKIYCVNLETW